ncbi:CBF1-interacting co-repressor CIR, N-terminal domain containing protein [Parasponia andersonii]|uniref:CBF1-interacting co-repressor CIR, N-terminal domain containing protein n=1 Tax=Parasponia andersonii TaxID=3476 RepID=A0A2P5CRF6_PARAD|nr:CBF1-interacting co-repressor CIR, N-terminal domain containing protein [Parasponia andersonii]
MEGEEGEGIRLSKRFSSETSKGGGEVDYKTKSGTAWSHSYLNQKPWHPLSYPNQRRKWIAEQTHANRQRRAEEVAREYAQEQEFFRQTALVSKKEQEKLEIMKAVSFMYVRPPGYNAESAKAAEIADERKMEEQNNQYADGPSTSMPPESVPGKDQSAEEKKKKPRPKDVFGRPLPTEEEFEILKNAPRLETGVAGRIKPFGVEVRNVKCVRCGTYGHQSGDRECPLRDVIMPNEQSRLKRDDPLTAILAHTDPSEPLKWELKQKPGISPPRGGFKSDDPNQQIVAEEIFDEYGGFLSGGNIPELLTNFSGKPKKSRKKKSNHKRQQLSPNSEELEEDVFSSDSKDRERRSKKRKHKKSKTKKKNRQNRSETSLSDVSDFNEHNEKRNHKNSYSSEESDEGRHQSNTQNRRKRSYSSEDSDDDRYGRSNRSRYRQSFASKESNTDCRHRSRHKRSYYSSEDPDLDGQYRSKDKQKRSYSCQHSESERQHGSGKQKHRQEHSDSDQHRHRHSHRQYRH